MVPFRPHGPAGAPLTRSHHTESRFKRRGSHVYGPVIYTIHSVDGNRAHVIGVDVDG